MDNGLKQIIFCVLTLTNFLLFDLASQEYNLNKQQFYIGPEWYHVKRTKSGGTKQQGHLLGGRLGYGRLKRYGWYWGGEGSYAHGRLKGHSGTGNKLRSYLADLSIEGRFGYTLQKKCGFQAACTPFVGVGYFEEKNHFVHPSPLFVHFKTHFYYVVVGFLSSLHLCDQWEIGLNFKTKIPINPKCHVSHDEDNEPMSQRIGERLHYRVELPLTYSRSSNCSPFAFALVPFFESRLYGSHPNFPYNFVKTRFENWGLTLELQYRL